jgi:hypothetical protein
VSYAPAEGRKIETSVSEMPLCQELLAPYRSACTSMA